MASDRVIPYETHIWIFANDRAETTIRVDLTLKPTKQILQLLKGPQEIEINLTWESLASRLFERPGYPLSELDVNDDTIRPPDLVWNKLSFMEELGGTYTHQYFLRAESDKVARRDSPSLRVHFELAKFFSKLELGLLYQRVPRSYFRLSNLVVRLGSTGEEFIGRESECVTTIQYRGWRREIYLFEGSGMDGPFEKHTRTASVKGRESLCVLGRAGTIDPLRIGLFVGGLSSAIGAILAALIPYLL